MQIQNRLPQATSTRRCAAAFKPAVRKPLSVRASATESAQVRLLQKQSFY